MTSQHSHHMLVALDCSLGNKLLDAGDCCGGGRLTTNSVAANDRLCVSDLLLAYSQELPARPTQCPPRLFPGNGSAYFDRGSQRMWVVQIYNIERQVFFRQIPFVLQEEISKGSSTRGLHDRNAWHSINQTEFEQLMKTFAES